jgi:hypothetical protein
MNGCNVTLPYDLAVAYRVCDKPSKHAPPVHAGDKFALVKLCLESFLRATEGLRVKMFVILDDCPMRYEELFRIFIQSENLEFIHLRSAGNEKTFKKSVRLLLEQSDSEYIYFAEDDYFYLPGVMTAALDEMCFGARPDFLTLYDHPDYHETALHRLPLPGAPSGWQRRISTTMTFMTTRTTLRLWRGVFEAPTYGLMPDLALWLALTGQRLWNPFTFLKWCVTDRFWAASVVLAWVLYFRHVAVGYRLILLAPDRPMATHMVADKLAPGIFQRPMRTSLPRLKPKEIDNNISFARRESERGSQRKPLGSLFQT